MVVGEAKPDNMNVVHPRAAGLDVHKMSITASVRIWKGGGEDGNAATRTFPATAGGYEEMAGWLSGCGVTAAAMEATGIHWEAPLDDLEAAGIKPLLLNAQHAEQVRGRKTDVGDSVWLARICQFELARPSLVLPKRFRELRALSRCRRQAAGDRSRVRNPVHKLVDRAGLRVGGVLSDIFGVNGRRILDGLAEGLPAEDILAGLSSHVARKLADLEGVLSFRLHPHARVVLGSLLDQHDRTERMIADCESILRRELAGNPEDAQSLRLLQTIPGVGPAAAGAILAELGPDIGVFASQEHCAAWAGVCPGNNESGGRRRSGRARKGNPALRKVLVECAHAAARTRDCQFHSYFRALKARKSHKQALFATAHKLLRVIHSVLKNRRPYEDPGTDYREIMARRNAPRWIRMMKEYSIEYPAAGQAATQPA